MKALRRDLQSVIGILRVLTEKTEKILSHIDSMEGVQATQNRHVKVAKSAARKKGPETATEMVLSIIRRQKKGIDTTALKKKTELDTKTIRNVIFRLKKQGKVQSTARGIYMAA